MRLLSANPPLVATRVETLEELLELATEPARDILTSREDLCLPYFVRSGSRRPSQVLVMQSTDARHLHHSAPTRQLHSPRLGCAGRADDPRASRSSAKDSEPQIY